MIEDWPNHSQALGVKDRRSYGIVASMFMINFATLFGIEIRSSIVGGDLFVPIVAIFSYLVVCFVIRAIIIDRRIYHPRLRIGKKIQKVSLQPVEKRVQDYINARAAEVGLIEKIDVLYIPNSWNIVDAYVFGSGNDQVLVMTGGLQMLFFRELKEGLDRFRFIVDHELGHIAGKDTNVLFLSESSLIAFIIFFPIKLILNLFLTTHESANFVKAILPSELLGFSDFHIIISGTVSNSLAIGLNLIFSFITALILLECYATIVRRREFAADRFAYNHSLNRKELPTIVETVFSTPSLRSAPPHSFKGKLRWHPKIKDRIKNTSSSIKKEVPEIIVLSLIVMSLIWSRIVLNGITNYSSNNIQFQNKLILLSAFYALLIGLILSWSVRNQWQKSAINRLKNGIIETAKLVFGGFIITMCLCGILYAVKSNSSTIPTISPYQAILDIEFTERTWLLFSLPITIGIFGLCFSLLDCFCKTVDYQTGTELTIAVAGTAIAVVLLWGISKTNLADMEHYHQTKLCDFLMALPSSFKDEKSLEDMGIKIDDDPASNTSQVQEFTRCEMLANDSLDTTLGMCLVKEIEFMMDLNPLSEVFEQTQYNEQQFCKYLIRSQEHYFTPPMCFIAVWQDPYSAN